MASLQFYDAVASGMMRQMLDIANRHKFDLNDYFKDVRERDHRGQCPIHMACSKGHAVMVKYLIDVGCDINKQTRELRRTALHMTINKRHPQCFKLLLDAGADIDVKDTFCYTAAHYAADHGFCDMLEALIAKGSDLDTQDITGKTALMKAVRSRKYDAAQLLLQAGCDANILNQNNDTSLHFAARMGSLDLIDLLMSSNCLKDVVNRWGNTPLMEAVNYNREAAVKKLIDHGCNVNLHSICGGDTALHIAVRKNYTPIALLLIQAGCNQNIFNSQGRSPIFEAVVHNYQDTIKGLVRLNYDLSIPAQTYMPNGGHGATACKESAFLAALRAGNFEICKLISNFNCDTLPSDDVLANYPHSIDAGLKTALRVVPSLHHWCRKKIRQMAGTSIFEVVEMLILPKALKDDLVARELS